MAYKIKLGTFSKLENSTAQPTTATWAEYDITLKNGCDISNPDILISIDYATAAGYNYAYFLNRYYWIVGRNMIRENLCAISLKVDPMATYKTQIGAAPLYILRASAASDGSIRDTYYPIKATNTKYRDLQPYVPVGGYETSVPGDYNSGIVVLNIAGTGTAGASTLVEVTAPDFANLVRELYTDINGFQLSDVIPKVVQAFGGNPQSLINSATWFPFPFSADGGTGYVQIGAWTSAAIIGGIITDPAILLPDVTFTLQKHPLAATRGSYLNLSPYTLYTLGLPGVGVINLDTGKLQNETGITVHRTMDAFTGQLIVKVEANTSGQTLAFMNGQIGIPIQLRGSNNANSLISGAVATIGGIAGAVATGGASTIAGAVAAGVGTALEAVGGTPTSSSMGAGFAGITDQRIWLDTVCYDITDADNTEHGRPYCQMATPSSLTGFMVVSEGYVAIPGPLPEQQEVRRLLETGFFYE